MTVYNVLKDLKNPDETFTTAARRHFISTTTAQSIFDKYVHISRRTLPRIICIDEVYAYHSSKGDYVCVLLDYDAGTLLICSPPEKKIISLTIFPLFHVQNGSKSNLSALICGRPIGSLPDKCFLMPSSLSINFMFIRNSTAEWTGSDVMS